MDFDLLDDILELGPDRVVAVKHVRPDEPCFRDHFPTFPILPGVLMLETMVQAARRLIARDHPGRFVLGGVRAVKYGAMVKPGMTLRVEITQTGTGPEHAFKGKGLALGAGTDPADAPTAVSGRFTLRPVRVCAPRACPGAA